MFLDPQDEVGTAISSSVVLCLFVLLVYIVVLVLVVCLCPSSVRVVATFSGAVLFPLLFSFLIVEIFICNNHINGLLSLPPLPKSCSFVLRYMEALSKVGCIR